jgi:hypothetical protein
LLKEKRTDKPYCNNTLPNLLVEWLDLQTL